MYVARRMGTKSDTYAVSASTKPARLCKSDPKRVCLLVQNIGTETVYVTSAQTKKDTDGQPIAKDGWYVNDTTTAELYVITASGTADVRVQVDGD